MSNQKASEEFMKLLALVDHLLGPGGCAWDREQTLVSMRAALLEEACEVIEAIDEEDTSNLIEELGDIFCIAVFLCKLAEKERLFYVEQPLRAIQNKLISRHPHVFGEKKISDPQAILAQWEEIKKVEKSDRESLMDGIPKGLPSLARAYKIAGKMENSHYSASCEGRHLFHNEEELGVLLWTIVREARLRDLHPENALRKETLKQENAFRQWEKSEAQCLPKH